MLCSGLSVILTTAYTQCSLLGAQLRKFAVPPVQGRRKDFFQGKVNSSFFPEVAKNIFPGEEKW